MVYLTFFTIPLLIAIAAYILCGARITFKELLLQLAIQAIVVGVICACSYYSNTIDREIWNGRVASKSRDVVSCSHAYPCRCRPVSCGKNCTSIYCDTCYSHSYDVDWNLRTTNNEALGISRVDSQGVVQPPRWTSVAIGEPTAVSHMYENYIKGAPSTLFRDQGSDVTEPMPAYPGEVYDYYRLNRLVQIGISVPDADQWNARLSDLNAENGHKKQANMVVVLVKDKPRQWFRQLERTWIGGKKNDSILVIGVSSATAVSWAEVMTWTNHSYYKVKLRDQIEQIGTLDREAILTAFAETMSAEYVRKPMSDFAYLKASIVPSKMAYIIGIIIATLIALGLSYYMDQNDVFGEEPKRNYNYQWG